MFGHRSMQGSSGLAGHCWRLGHEIFFHDGEKHHQLTDNSYYDGNAQINENGQVVWMGWGGSDWEISFMTGDTQIGQPWVSNFYPQINSDSQVIWQGNDAMTGNLSL